MLFGMAWQWLLAWTGGTEEEDRPQPWLEVNYLLPQALPMDMAPGQDRGWV